MLNLLQNGILTGVTYPFITLAGVLVVVIAVVVPYRLGSINSAVLISKCF